MDPVRSQVTVARPPAEVYAYLADVANLPTYADHFIRDVQLTREDTVGAGAGIRFAVRQRRQRYPYMDLYVHEAVPGRRLVLIGRAFKFNRVRVVLTFELEEEGAASTRVALSFESQGKLPTDRLFERRAFFKRRWAKALRRLEAILEDGRGAGARATIAGGARKPASGFRFEAPAATSAE